MTELPIPFVIVHPERKTDGTIYGLGGRIAVRVRPSGVTWCQACRQSDCEHARHVRKWLDERSETA